MTHVINTLRFEAICRDEGLAFNLRQNFAQTLQQQIAEVIDQICSEYVEEGEFLKLDKLELDLGSFNKSRFGNEFKDVFRSRFETELKEQIAKISSAERQVSHQLTQSEMFFYFLFNGTLPWWAGDEIDPDKICRDIHTNQKNMLKYFLHHNRSKENVWHRVLWQLNNESKELIIDLSAELKYAQSLFTKWVAKIINRINDPDQAHIGLKKIRLQKNELQHYSERINDMLISNAVPIIASYDDTEALKKIFETHTHMIFNESKALADWAHQEFRGISSDSDTKDITAQDIRVEKSVESIQPDEKFAIKNAGIVLLAPFLKPFFKELHLLDGDNWESRDAAFKAVHLLKFLANGKIKAPEYSLVLEKVLCGLAIDAPIPMDITLKDKDIKEAEALLKAVIGHWKAIKNTSVNGLRETFLKRDGLLTKKGNDWLIQIEQKTLDVLLEKLPWGYSTISLTWNSYLVFVEW